MSLSPSLAWGLAALLLFGVASFELHAQPAGAPAMAQPQGRSWASLSPAQQQALAPLQREWNSIDALRKTKWIEVADRLPALSPEERSRIQTRMAEWARLSPAERGQARLNFKAAQINVETVKIGRGPIWIVPLAFAIAIGVCVAVYFA